MKYKKPTLLLFVPVNSFYSTFAQNSEFDKSDIVTNTHKVSLVNAIDI